MSGQGERLLVFVGSYAEPEGPGVYVMELNEETGGLTKLDEVSGLKNPTFLNVDVQGRKLYAISEGTTSEGNRTGSAYSYTVDPEKGSLTEMNHAVTVNAPTCHIQRDASGRYLVVASYHGGLVGLVELRADGTLGRLLDVKQHEGHGPNPERQEQPHPHSAFFSRDNRFVFVPDLGLDRIVSYALDSENNVLKPHGETPVPPGAGPRHMAFHPGGRLAFVINEIDSTVTSLRYDEETGVLEPIETVTTLPEGFTGENICAEIVVSEDGAFVYGSNRGHDSIVVFAVDEAGGKLTLVEHVSAEGKHPRNFALTPGGAFLIAANRDTDNIATFRVDRSSGRLQYTGQSAAVSKPVCVRPAYL